MPDAASDDDAFAAEYLEGRHLVVVNFGVLKFHARIGRGRSDDQGKCSAQDDDGLRVCKMKPHHLAHQFGSLQTELFERHATLPGVEFRKGQSLLVEYGAKRFELISVEPLDRDVLDRQLRFGHRPSPRKY